MKVLTINLCKVQNKSMITIERNAKDYEKRVTLLKIWVHLFVIGSINTRDYM
jgi:hypothetical protein